MPPGTLPARARPATACSWPPPPAATCSRSPATARARLHPPPRPPAPAAAARPPRRWLVRTPPPLAAPHRAPAGTGSRARRQCLPTHLLPGPLRAGITACPPMLPTTIARARAPSPGRAH
ncbi:hypothetical protein DENSPDRAFT_886689 [Dentipellis sp. KUC8613]|nr:hypothetical protein DENSPDRAFT_886689 [Dentipellis sp. KUC8613]